MSSRMGGKVMNIGDIEREIICAIKNTLQEIDGVSNIKIGCNMCCERTIWFTFDGIEYFMTGVEEVVE